MTEPLTDQQIADMQARESAATPPPWRASEAKDAFVTVIRSEGPDARDLARVSALSSDADGQFMAHARTDMPALLAEVDRLRRLDQAHRNRIRDLRRERAVIDDCTAGANRQITSLRAELAQARAAALNEAAANFDQLADQAEAKAAARFPGIGADGACDMLRDAARLLRNRAALPTDPA